MDSWELGDSSGTKNVAFNGTVATFRYPCSNNHLCTYYKSRLPPGYYKLEVWGAQGGACYYDNNFYAAQGMGGYSVGVVKLEKETDVYVYIGGKGEDGNVNSPNGVKGGFNGGGNSPPDYDVSDSGADVGGGGGGASDIRINGNSWSNRIIVAGGGGGNGFWTGYYKVVDGQYGGGLSGGHPMGNSNQYGTAADQTNGYQFDQGENGIYQSSTASGGGGGGYKGGFTYIHGSGGGGSGYIGGVIDYNGIVKKTIPGNQNIIQVDGTSRKGNTGHGAARITLIGYGISIENKIEDHYSPGSLLKFNVSLTSMGKEEQSTMCRIIDNNESLVDTHNDTGTSYTYADSFYSPIVPGFYDIKYKVRSKSGAVTEHKFRILVSSIPIIINKSRFQNKFVQGENLTLPLEVRDDTYITLKINDGASIDHTYTVPCYGENNLTNYHIVIPHYEVGSTHKVSITGVDEFGLDSNVLQFDVIIVTNNPPLARFETKIDYMHTTSSNMSALVGAKDQDGISRICMCSIMDYIYFVSHQCLDVRDTDWHLFPLSIPVRNYEDGIHVLSVYSIDEHNAQSEKLEHTFALNRKWIRETFSCSNQWTEFVTASLYVILLL